LLAEFNFPIVQTQQFISSDAHLFLFSVDLVSSWPSAVLKIGQVGGIATDTKGHLHIFHRADRVWEQK
jgi:hypothetical protein